MVKVSLPPRSPLKRDRRGKAAAAAVGRCAAVAIGRGSAARTSASASCLRSIARRRPAGCAARTSRRPAPSAVGHAVAHACRVPVGVVLDAPQLDGASASPERVGSTAVAVERQPDAAGVDQQPAALGLALELDVAVPEEDHLLLVWRAARGRRRWAPAMKVSMSSCGRRMADKRLVDRHRRREVEQQARPAGRRARCGSTRSAGAADRRRARRRDPPASGRCCPRIHVPLSPRSASRTPRGKAPTRA